MSFVKANVKPIEPENPEIQQTMCQAHGCPNRWIINDAKGKLCRLHHHAEPVDWPQITSAILQGKTPNLPVKQEQAAGLNSARQKALEEFKAFTRGNNLDRTWAHRLKAREEAGERLSIVQKQLWRDALRHRDDEE